MVAEALKLFGAPHYRDYHFLLTLERSRGRTSASNITSAMTAAWVNATLLSADGRRELAGLLGYEFAHSWNGKFRRPADLDRPLLRSADEDRSALGLRRSHVVLGARCLRFAADLWTAGRLS